MKTSGIEVHQSVGAALSPRTQLALEQVVSTSRLQSTPLPEGFKIVFHNTEPQFTFGEVIPGRIHRETTALLRHDFGRLSPHGHTHWVDMNLCVREHGAILRESLSSFVARADRMAREKIDDLAYLRSYPAESRSEIIAERGLYILHEKGLRGAEYGVLQHAGTTERKPALPLFFVDRGDVTSAAGILEQWRCHADSSLPPRTDDGPRALQFDTLPVVVCAKTDKMRYFNPAPQNDLRTPTLYCLQPAIELQAILGRELKG